MSEVKHFEAGTTIFRQGEFGTCMYRVVNGTVGIYRSYADAAKEQLLTELNEGKYFGELGLVGYCGRSADAIAMTDVDLEVITNAEFDDYLINHTEEMFPVLDAICVRVRELTNDYDQLCSDLSEYAEAEGVEPDRTLMDRIRRFADLGKLIRKMSDVMSV